MRDSIIFARVLVVAGALAIGGLLAGLAGCDSARAQSVEAFYRGRTVTIVIGFGVGGGYDVGARVLARHLGKHIPGNPTDVAQNMPGGGNLRAANYLYNVAPKDGATLGVFARGMAMEPLIGTGDARFDSRKFNRLGSVTNEVSVCATFEGSKVKTWNDALRIPFTVGGDGPATDPDIFSIMLKNVFGAKLRLISGYPGGADITLALERGEIDGRCGWTWSSVRLQRPDWIGTGKLNLLIQLAMQKSPELPDVPLIMDLAATERQRRIVTMIIGRQPMGRPLAAPPGIPADRAEITEPNQNVFYELGYAHGKNKPTILLAEKGRQLPFDVRGYRCLFYENSIGGKQKIEDGLRKHLQAIFRT
jgi:tripartite-type tricarboxylate transporter receptor subunit TctC